MKIWIAVFLLALLAGCADTPDSTPTASDSADTIRIGTGADVERINVSVNGIDLFLSKPDGWESYTTDYGIVLAENIASVAQAGQLDGLLMHIFVPPLEDLMMDAAQPSNLAWDILSEIIENPNYIGGAAVSAPFAFEWDKFDAAYYLLDNGDGNLSIVLGVAEPRTGQLITCHISAPSAEAHRIRESLPNLLNNLTLNGVQLPGEMLNTLPEPFEFPQQDASTGTNILTGGR